MIRPAAPTDAEALAALWNPWIRDTAITFNPTQKTPDDLVQMIHDRAKAGHGFFVAAEGNGPLLGFASYGPFRSGLGYARTMEHTIVLAPDARGKGIGRALMTSLESHARASGTHALMAGVSAENPEGRAFHSALGFAEVARLPEVGFKFGRFIDLVLMQKILS